MQPPVNPKPNGISAYTVILLEHGREYLLLQRSAEKQFAPNLWTGIGGKVEQDEFGDLWSSALRELYEESGIRIDALEHFCLRRVMLQNRPGFPLTLLLYFTGNLAERMTPHCPEGRLFWKTAAEIAALDIIETSKPILPLLVSDIQRDPSGQEPVCLGLGIFQNGRFQGLTWGN